MVSVLAVS